MAFDTTAGVVKPTDDRHLRFITLKDSLLSQPSASARVLAALTGQMESLSHLLPQGNLHKRRTQRAFRMP